MTNKHLHKQKIATRGNKTYHRIDENILSERQIMEYLSKQEKYPKTIVKYHTFFKRYFQILSINLFFSFFIGLS